MIHGPCFRGCQHRGFVLNELRPARQAAIKKEHELYCELGLPKWASVTGLVSAALLSLNRIGWKHTQYSIWCDDLGIPRELSDFHPRLFQKFLMEAYLRSKKSCSRRRLANR